MNNTGASLISRICLLSLPLFGLLVGVGILGIARGSSGWEIGAICKSLIRMDTADPVLTTIIWRIRLPRVLLAALVGASLSAGGLVFQALLRNPLAEPYILGISGGAAVGAIIGILLGLAPFPGISIAAFIGSGACLLLILFMATCRTILKNESLLLSGVMINAFCSAIIMFLIAITQDARIHNIMFWLMGDLSMVGLKQVTILAALVIPCFIVVFRYANILNLILLGREMAQTMGVNIRVAGAVLLVVTSFMVSATVSQCGLLGFVGLVVPHFFRRLIGADHRLLVPACLLGGGAYMVLCDMLARTLPAHGEMPVGVITAILGAPLFIYLLKRPDKK
ncbi:MAG: iron ABC transporter permease [Thermodesulfobacteriota bacterium]|nr:iron ABC transporter permease [Thermodesulfobacteriota bacterium]